MEITRMSYEGRSSVVQDPALRADAPALPDVEAVAFGVFASSAVWRTGDSVQRVEVARAAWDRMRLEDRARWLQRGRDTITYALGYVP